MTYSELIKAASDPQNDKVLGCALEPLVICISCHEAVERTENELCEKCRKDQVKK